MSAAEKRLIWKYVLAGLAAFGMAAGGVLVTQLSSTDPINWRPVIAAGLGAVLPLLATYRLPRGGSAKLAEQVDERRAEGVSRKEMTVATARDMVLPFSPVVIEVAAEVERLVAEGHPIDELMIVPRQSLRDMSSSQRRVLGDR